LTPVGYGLAPIRGKSCDVNKSVDLWIVASFGDHHSAVGVAYKNHRAILRVNNTLGCGYVVRQRYRRMLDDGDIVAILL